MRITSCKLFLLWVLALCGIVAANPSDELQVLYEKRQYFDLRDKLAEQKSGSSERYIFYRAVVENKFNRPERSISTVAARRKPRAASRRAGSSGGSAAIVTMPVRKART